MWRPDDSNYAKKRQSRRKTGRFESNLLIQKTQSNIRLSRPSSFLIKRKTIEKLHETRQQLTPTIVGPGQLTTIVDQGLSKSIGNITTFQWKLRAKFSATKRSVRFQSLESNGLARPSWQFTRIGGSFGNVNLSMKSSFFRFFTFVTLESKGENKYMKECCDFLNVLNVLEGA